MTAAAPSAPARTAAAAVLFMLAASALVAGTSLIAKALGLPASGAGLHPLQVSAGRFGFAFLTLMAVLAVRPALRPTLRTAHPGWHLARSIVGWLGVTAMFAAVARMPVADATAISFLSPTVTMLLAVLMLGESLTARKIAATVMALAGALLILRPGTEAFQPAAWLALASAGFMALEFIFIKRLSDAEPALRILVINNAIGATISILAASFVWTAPDAQGWGLLVLIGVVMVSAQSLFIQSMKRGEASLVSPVFYAVLVFAALYDFLFFAVRPTVFTLAGATLIVAGALLLASRRRGGGTH